MKMLTDLILLLLSGCDVAGPGDTARAELEHAAADLEARTSQLQAETALCRPRPRWYARAGGRHTGAGESAHGHAADCPWHSSRGLPHPVLRAAGTPWPLAGGRGLWVCMTSAPRLALFFGALASKAAGCEVTTDEPGASKKPSAGPATTLVAGCDCRAMAGSGCPVASWHRPGVVAYRPG